MQIKCHGVVVIASAAHSGCPQLEDRPSHFVIFLTQYRQQNA